MAEPLTRLGGAVLSALAASACCLGPLLCASLGLGGVGAMVALEPYRPVFIALTVGLLAAGWVSALFAGAAADDCGCERPRVRRAGRGLLASLTVSALLILGLPGLIGALQGEPTAPEQVRASRIATFTIAGMTCGSCAMTIEVALQNVPGIASVDVDVARGRAVVRFDGDRVRAARITEVITQTGYPASLVSDMEA